MRTDATPDLGSIICFSAPPSPGPAGVQGLYRAGPRLGKASATPTHLGRGGSARYSTQRRLSGRMTHTAYRSRPSVPPRVEPAV